MSKKAYTKAHVDQMRRWQIYPLEWVKAIFGENILKAQINAGRVRNGYFVYTGKPVTETGLSYQQEEVLRLWGRLIEAKLLLASGDPLTEEQKILSTKIGMSIQSSNGNGKDFLASIINWHFEYCFENARGLATANTGHQLKNVFWSEMANVRGLAKVSNPQDPNCQSDLHALFEMQADKLFAKLPNKEDRGKKWFIELVTINTKSTPEEQGEALAGRHADHLLITIDEASDIPDPVFKPIERTLTGKLNLVFMIFNPTRNTGFAIDSHGKDRERWVTVQWNAIDSDNVKRDQIAQLKTFGETSPAYRIGVLGLPPLMDSDALIPYNLIMAAVEREFDISEFDPIIGAVDAGGGGDDSTIGNRQGPKVGPIQARKTSNPDDLADWSANFFLEEEADVVFVDNIGLGWYLPQALKNRKIDARAADARSTSTLREPEKFLNKRAEMYWDLKMDFVNGCISIPNDRDLINELGAIKEERVGNKIKIGSKKEIRAKYGWSPNKADLLALQKFKAAHLFRKGTKKRSKSIDYSQVFKR